MPREPSIHGTDRLARRTLIRRQVVRASRSWKHGLLYCYHCLLYTSTILNIFKEVFINRFHAMGCQLFAVCSVQIPGRYDNIGIYVISIFMYCSLRFHLHYLLWVSNLSCHGRSCSDSRIGQINFRQLMSHSSYKVPVGGSYTSFIFCQYSHIASQTRSACRRDVYNRQSQYR